MSLNTSDQQNTTESNIAKPIGRALISVSNKDGIIDFATALQQYHIEILSTGGTYRLLNEAGIKVREVFRLYRVC